VFLKVISNARVSPAKKDEETGVRRTEMLVRAEEDIDSDLSAGDGLGKMGGEDRRRRRPRGASNGEQEHSSDGTRQIRSIQSK
jgi:hypothetical protein